MKMNISCVLFALLLLLLAVVAGRAASGAEWTMELRNNGGASATLNKVWCGSPLGDLSFGPVSGADTSAPDGSIWAVTQQSDQSQVQLHLPSLDYSCRLEVQGFSPPLWSFSLPLTAAAADDVSPGDIKCTMPSHISGIGHVPPSCELFNADGYAATSVLISPLTMDDADSPAPAPTAPLTSTSADLAAAAVSPASIPASERNSNMMMSAPAPTPRPLRHRLL